MGNIVKTEYMNRPTLGFSEYLTKTTADLPPDPHVGDRAIVVTEGKLYCCVESGNWEEFKVNGGNTE